MKRSELHEIAVRRRGDPDVKALLLEIKRLHGVLVQAHEFVGARRDQDGLNRDYTDERPVELLGEEPGRHRSAADDPRQAQATGAGTTGHPCQFLAERVLKPAESIDCLAIRTLCDKDKSFGLCQTGDEAMLLQNYLLLTGGDHFPMLVPQPSILHGKRRPDFVCFMPITKFQYYKVAVFVDRPGKNPNMVTAENTEYEQQGFIVKRLLVEPNMTHFKRARDLVNWLELL